MTARGWRDPGATLIPARTAHIFIQSWCAPARYRAALAMTEKRKELLAPPSVAPPQIAASGDEDDGGECREERCGGVQLVNIDEDFLA